MLLVSFRDHTPYRMTSYELIFAFNPDIVDGDHISQYGLTGQTTIRSSDNNNNNNNNPICKAPECQKTSVALFVVWTVQT